MPSPSITLLRTQSDDRLVALARAGHERAFEAIVDRYRRPLLRAARRVLPEARAEDALQQALIAAWTGLQRGDEVRELRAWLYRIVHNTALNALRVSGYDYVELEDTLRLADAGDDELERRAVVRQTLASLAALPERQREALLRTAVSGFSQQEVARDLGISDNAMRQLVHRARVSVRAAATALTPLPLVTAAASGARGIPLADRIAELAAGAAPAGATVTLAKAGTVVVLAGTALSGPTLADRVADRPQRETTAAAAAAAASQPPRGARPAAATGASSAPVAARRERVAPRTPSPRSADGRRPVRERRAGEREHRSGPGDGEDSAEPHSGPGGQDPGDDELREPSRDSGESGSGGSEHSGSGESGSGESDSGSGSESPSGSGGDGSDDPPDQGDSSGPGGSFVPPVPSATPVAPDADSGHRSDDAPEE